MTRLMVAAALALMLGACGSDTGGSGGEPIDLAVPAPADLSTAGGTCSAANPGGCGGACSACLMFGGSGICVTPCSTASSTGCATGQSCHAIATDGGGANVVFSGACAAFDGYCA